MNDEWTPVTVDDPAPPEPDAALLASVVSRGRQRLVRRRAVLGVTAAAIAVVVGSAVAVANGKTHRDRVHVVTPAPPPVNGWIAMDGTDGDLYLVRPGAPAHRLNVVGAETADD